MNCLQAAEMSQVKTLEVKVMEKVTLAEPPIKTADREELQVKIYLYNSVFSYC